jgi:hypothetical protein
MPKEKETFPITRRLSEKERLRVGEVYLKYMVKEAGQHSEQTVKEALIEALDPVSVETKGDL